MFIEKIIIYSFRELNLEPILEECRMLLGEMNVAETNPILSEIMATPFNASSKSMIERHHKDLITSQQQLMTSFQEAESRLLHATKSDKYRTKAEKVIKI